MSKLNIFRFSVFWIWSLTLLVSIGVFIGTLIVHKMTFREIEDPLTQIMGLLVPQLSIMTAFFFGANKEKQSEILAQNENLGTFALGLSFFYHISFWAIIWLSIGLGVFGATIDENCLAAIKIIGFLSIFGLSPVAYLFANGAARA